jgi:branched-chain amino acid transport system ATP-binding protein
MTNMLELDGISLRFGGVSALREIALTIRNGEIHSIIGPNGAGKSSLLNVMTGLYRPDSGSIRLDRETFKTLPVTRLARLGVARTFQNIALFRGLSVRDNIALGLTHKARASVWEQLLGLKRARRERQETENAVTSLIEKLHLTEYQYRPVAGLPYGIQKRVELARALIARPKLLLLDEPMAGMTSGEKSEMTALIRAARDEQQMTIVLVEHDMGVVMGISDWITVLDHGVRIADGPPAVVQTTQAVIEAYLGLEEAEELAPVAAELAA